MVDSLKPVRHRFLPGAPQQVELAIVVEVFKACPFAFNLVSDSYYVVNALKLLEYAGTIKTLSSVCALFMQLQALIWQRKHPFFVQHIRAHTGLPGPLARGNDRVDRCTRPDWVLFTSAMQRAYDFHKEFHVNARTLQQKFAISRSDVRKVVTDCPHCAISHHPQILEVNPRGLLPLKIWQMDVTHIPEFGKVKYVHVSVDTCSGIIHATPMTGEKATHVIAHCLEAWAAWGKPQQLKTDNGPAYTGGQFTSFCKQMGVQLVHGLPYNPQGQGIVERAHRSLKELLQKQKGGIGHGQTPRNRLSLVVFTLNFLNLDNADQSAADRHSRQTGPSKGMVTWKDVLTGSWHGPDPMLAWARDSVCVFPQNQLDPIWVPERLVRKARGQTETEEDGENTSGNDRSAPVPSRGTSDSGAAMGDPGGFPEANAGST